MSGESLVGQNIVVFDLEIKETPGENGITWKDHPKFGISVGALFDFKTLEYSVYMDDNLSELTDRLNTASLVVGFNILQFDIPVLKATLENKSKLNENLPTYDMLYYARLATGWDPHDPRSRYPSGLKLDDLLLGTFGPPFVKTGDGALAPSLWKTSQLGRLVTYCISDVNREGKCFRRIWEGRPLLCKTHGELMLKHPKDVMEEL
jgi:DEAD/DEAH box helicase domain-containing protein